MGYGMTIQCKCQAWEVACGVGFGYPMAYQETLSDIKAGKYGEEMKKLVNETELVTVDADCKVYYCPQCGQVNSYQCLNLYQPNDIESAKKARVGGWTGPDQRSIQSVGELGDWPYWLPDLSRPGENGDYVLLKKYDHLCPVCNSSMTEMDEEKLTNEKITCPKCGAKYKKDVNMFWD